MLEGYGVPLGVGVFGDESGSDMGEDSSSAIGVSGAVVLYCFGATEVAPESRLDSVMVSVSVMDDEAVEGDRDFRRLARDDPSSMVTSFTLLFIGVMCFDFWEEERTDPSPLLPDRHGLPRVDECLVLEGDLDLASRCFLSSLNFFLNSSAAFCKSSLLSSTTAACSTVVRGGLGGPFAVT